MTVSVMLGPSLHMIVSVKEENIKSWSQDIGQLFFPRKSPKGRIYMGQVLGASVSLSIRVCLGCISVVVRRYHYHAM